MFPNRPAANHLNVQFATPKERVVSETGDGPNNITGDVYFIRDRIQRRLLAESDGELNRNQVAQMRQMIEAVFNQVLVEENLLYTRANRTRILDWVIADILGFGPLEPLLQDPTVTEIMVNGPKLIYIERHGKIEETDVTFENDAHLMRVIDRIVSPIGRRVDETSPMVDARLPSGYRVNATIPLCLWMALVTIRKRHHPVHGPGHDRQAP
jgi:pilus assembly protein CpaF